ncbi:hypothetical protein P9G84_31885 [Brevibacillus centrosporus]|uniref:hypothetical protein n=1 Tax=Brevibacillus centrosporus TaxID=54910 RepID=UPI000F09FB27|nr:hypothetical protein [Brevibacillus centrosporus]MEC2133453.1 hypothetical protein [Brevibacillus centrosporus]RNB63170.1 hypothetical protein EDM55_29345 [Brevibacillus centrosporus]GED35008.1 hypothetical protein BCE02nite_61490 [Brevibacillus centrosporus]
MKKYRVDSHSWSSREYESIGQAEGQYELTKDRLMGEGVDEDGYVELVSSKDDFEDYTVLKRALVVVDEEKMKKSTPREDGYDFDYWAKWQEVDLPQ